MGKHIGQDDQDVKLVRVDKNHVKCHRVSREKYHQENNPVEALALDFLVVFLLQF